MIQSKMIFFSHKTIKVHIEIIEKYIAQKIKILTNHYLRLEKKDN